MEHIIIKFNQFNESLSIKEIGKDVLYKLGILGLYSLMIPTSFLFNDRLMDILVDTKNEIEKDINLNRVYSILSKYKDDPVLKEIFNETVKVYNHAEEEYYKGIEEIKNKIEKLENKLKDRLKIILNESEYKYFMSKYNDIMEILHERKIKL
jgi:type III secretory pathway component EscR